MTRYEMPRNERPFETEYPGHQDGNWVRLGGPPRGGRD